ncbi:MAG: hypothetical protein HY243_17140 [Proteobacteria bacterium]|nr:hypothetical protein [Pseudomonadota bacterium]
MKIRPLGVFLIAIFFVLATLILIGVGTALTVPGTPLDVIWMLRPDRRALLMPHREWLGPFFLALSLAMAAASLGCFSHRKWGWWLAVSIFAANGLGDAAQLLMGHVLEGLVGIAAAGAILFYLARPKVRGAFR